MPSPHLERKLKEALGEDAGAEMAAVSDKIDPLRGDMAELRQELLREFGAVRLELKSLDNRIATAKSDLIIWSFVFWVGAVGAIAALAGVLRS